MRYGKESITLDVLGQKGEPTAVRKAERKDKMPAAQMVAKNETMTVSTMAGMTVVWMDERKVVCLAALWAALSAEVR